MATCASATSVRDEGRDTRNLAATIFSPLNISPTMVHMATSEDECLLVTLLFIHKMAVISTEMNFFGFPLPLKRKMQAR